MAAIQTYDLEKFTFMVGQDGNLYVETDYNIENISSVFYLNQRTGDLYFTDVMPWRGLYWELQPDDSYKRMWG